MSVLILDQAGTALPEGLSFFKPGWWVVHVLAVVLVFSYGYRKGRAHERRARRLEEVRRNAETMRGAGSRPGGAQATVSRATDQD
ncbi:MAG TPA: hypothetical protein VGK93_06450 [Candidatus Eisenbacteria bacterium]|jgi:hypothetical protein